MKYYASQAIYQTPKTDTLCIEQNNKSTKLCQIKRFVSYVMVFFVSFHSNGIRLNDIYSIITHVMSCIWYASWKHGQRVSVFLYKVCQTSCNGDSEVSLYILKINILIIDYFWALGIKYSRLV